jgi:hypothetical protein
MRGVPPRIEYIGVLPSNPETTVESEFDFVHWFAAAPFDGLRTMTDCTAVAAPCT